MSTSQSILWNAVDAAAATGGRSRRYWETAGVSIDSRTAVNGDLFVALTTDQRDGHEFVKAALAGGAAAAMVAHVPEGVAEDAPLLLVDDTMSGLERLGMFARTRSQAKRIAITGSVGKTGTKDALKSCLTAIGTTHASAASYNNQWGVPLTLARLPVTADFGVFEIGMNHSGEIAALSPQVSPEISIITTVAAAHLAFFQSTEDIARAKAEIFLGTAAGGSAIIHGDAPHAALLAQLASARQLDVVTFGRGEGNRCRLVQSHRENDLTFVEAIFDDEPYSYSLAPDGAHWVDNSLAVLVALKRLAVPLEQALAPLASFELGSGRGARRQIMLPGGEISLADESFNANPASVSAALRTLGPMPGRKVAILGDMLELGTSAPAMHADLAALIEEQQIDLVLTCGPLMAMLNAAVPAKHRGPHGRDAAALAAQLSDCIEAGDQVLVKGSKASRMHLVVAALDAMAVSADKSPQRSTV